MTITIQVTGSKYNEVKNLVEGLQKIIGKDMRVTAEPLKPEQGATRPRKPSKKERMQEFDEMITTGKWRKPQHLKK